jgi:2-aminoethylphosphonate-pyruvate transaminase
MTVRRNILLNPGPATTTDTVKMAQVVPDICPREKEFGRLMKELTAGLTGLAADPGEYETVLFGGSGTAVMESMLISAAWGGKPMIVVNGAYGKRMVQIAESYGLSHGVFNSSPFEPVNTAQLEAAISADKTLTHLVVIHHETTTGLLNDLTSLGDLCRRYGLTFLVDGISSYAGMPMDLKRDNVAFMTSSSNKNIQGMAGVGFIICRRSDLEGLKGKKVPLYYLDLYAQYENFEKTGQTRFTPPVQTLYALKQALAETLAEGVGARYARYTACWEILHQGLEKLGLKYLVNREHQSRLITTIVDPDIPGYSFEGMHDWCYERGFTIYPGKVGEHKTFRIANIGDIRPEEMKGFIACLGEYLKALTGR